MAASRLTNGTMDARINSSSTPPAKRRKIDPSLFPCLVCKEPFRRRGDLWEHLTSKEKGVNVFVCLDCRRGFCNERHLRTHSCESMGGGEATSNGNRSALSTFCHIMACEECGLFVALVNTEIPCWKSYSSMCAHPSRSFRKITLYTWTPDAIRFIRSDLSIPFSVSIDFGPAVTDGVPITCDICGHRYSSVDDTEKHILEKHQDRYAPVQCQSCSSKFASPLRMELHVNEKHGECKRDLTDFLKSVPVVDPYVEKTVVGRNDSYVSCDLCQMDFLGNAFNDHDCVTNYMRRFLFNGKVIFCPAINLSKCGIDMSIQDPMLVSLTEKVQRHVELCLKFFIPVVAPKVDDFKMDQVYSCKHCERIIISPAQFREHVLEVLRQQRMEFERPKIGNNDGLLLLHFGLPVQINDDGFVCPKLGCATTWCSTVSLETHMRNVHEESFRPLTMPNIVPAPAISVKARPMPGGINIRPHPSPSISARPQTTTKNGLQEPMVERQCPICGEKGFRAQADLQAHVRDCHLHPCNACGICFVSEQRLNLHKRSAMCDGRLQNPPPLCYCPICKEVFQALSDYYCHLIVQHPTEAKHDEAIGSVLPKCNFFMAVRIAKNNQPATVTPPKQKAVVSNAATPMTKETPQRAEEVSTVQSASPNDDEIEVVSPQTSASTSVKDEDPVIEDDDVAVCEPEPGSSGRRQPTHGCNVCSRKFYTQKAAEEHRKTHESDAGLTTEEVLPVPNNTFVYVCRLCCLAYEGHQSYVEHMQKHRQVINCSVCTAVCLNPQYLESHLESHSTKALVFGCPFCLNAFRTETALMLHMNQAHCLPLLWYCHVCGLGNSDWRQMAAHVCKDTFPETPVITPTVVRKLHFQPRRGSIGNNNTASTSKSNGGVSECCHRSFLGCKETGIACKDCGTIIPATSYLPLIGEKPDGKFRLSLVDEASERAMIAAHPCTKRMKLEKVFANKPVKVLLPKMPAQRPLVPAAPPIPTTTTTVATRLATIVTRPNLVTKGPTILPKVIGPRQLLLTPPNSSNVFTVLTKSAPAPSTAPPTSAAANRNNALTPSATAIIRTVNNMPRRFY